MGRHSLVQRQQLSEDRLEMGKDGVNKGMEVMLQASFDRCE